jgi:hypothetical protein
MADYIVDRPGGGRMYLQSNEEMDLWESLERDYKEQYTLRKVNDLTGLGSLLAQQITLYRAQTALSGRLPELDDEDLPTGKYVMRPLKPAEIRLYQGTIQETQKEIRAIEKDLGIDKKSREMAADETLRGWLVDMKRRAHDYGLHVSKRVTAYEEFAMELRWRVRLNLNGDAEDKNYEECTDAKIIAWARTQLAELEQRDVDFAKDQGALIVGSTT